MEAAELRALVQRKVQDGRFANERMTAVVAGPGNGEAFHDVQICLQPDDIQLTADDERQAARPVDEDIVVVEAEQENEVSNARAIEAALRNAIVRARRHTSEGLRQATTYVKPPRWIVKSTAGNLARSTTRESSSPNIRNFNY